MVKHLDEYCNLHMVQTVIPPTIKSREFYFLCDVTHKANNVHKVNNHGVHYLWLLLPNW